ncbi:MAG: hypothetical protein AB1762_17910 [Gemmatimonadota bacterium]
MPRARLTYRGRNAVVTPYANNRIAGENACADILKRPEHVVTLRFADAGLASVRVEGRREPSGELASAEGTIQIAAPF